MISPMLPQVNGAELVSTPNELNMAQPVQGFANGGLLVPFQRPFLRASDREYLAARQAEYDKYMSDVGAYNTALTDWQTGVYSPYKSAVDAYNAAAQQYNTDVYNPYLAQVEAYNRAAQEYNVNTYQPYQSAYDQYVRAVEEWNAGPRTSAYAGPSAPSLTPFSMQAPTQPTAFSMAQPTLEREFTMAQPVMPFKEEDITAFQKSAAERAQFDAAQRGLAIEAVNDPRKFNLSGFSVSPKMFAKGGEARKMLERVPVVPRRFYDGGDVGGDPSGGDAGAGSVGADGSMGFGIEGGSYGGVGSGTVGYGGAGDVSPDALASIASAGISQSPSSESGKAAIAALETLDALGYGRMEGINAANPTQSVQEMLAAQNVANAVSVLAPGSLAVKGFQAAMDFFSPSVQQGAPVATVNLTQDQQAGGGPGVVDVITPVVEPPPVVETPTVPRPEVRLPTFVGSFEGARPVWGPDGRMYSSVEAAISAGVTNYSFNPPPASAATPAPTEGVGGGIPISGPVIPGPGLGAMGGMGLTPTAPVGVDFNQPGLFTPQGLVPYAPPLLYGTPTSMAPLPTPMAKGGPVNRARTMLNRLP